MTVDTKLLNGAMGLLLLDVLNKGESYGYAITTHVRNASGGRFEFKEGSLYPALHRLERDELIESFWVERPGERRRKYYRITAAGQAELQAQQRNWFEFTAGMNGVLGAQP